MLVIRGELLKKVPERDDLRPARGLADEADGHIDLTVRAGCSTSSRPPRNTTRRASKMRSPLYEAKADPDIYFFGFDLTVPEAKGGSGEHPNDDPGWFFVIKERPGEPRFGLETQPRRRAGRLRRAHLGRRPARAVARASSCPRAAWLPSTLVDPSPAEPDRQVQHDDDAQVEPAAISSARWAYLLFRAPVLVAVHADQMLSQAGA